MSRRRICTEAVIFDQHDRVLLVKQGRQRHDWELPGGKIRKNEIIVTALLREVREETGLDVEAERLIGLFQIPDEGYYDLVFSCRLPPGGDPREPRPNPPEIADCRFFAIDALPADIHPFTLARITEARHGVMHQLPVLLEAEEWLT